MSQPKPEHPLYVSDVMIWSGLFAGLHEDEFITECPVCARRQSLAEASIEPARGEVDVSVYRCFNGCALLAVTALPGPAPPEEVRVRLGDYVIGALAPAGITIRLDGGAAEIFIPPMRDTPSPG